MRRRTKFMVCPWMTSETVSILIKSCTIREKSTISLKSLFQAFGAGDMGGEPLFNETAFSLNKRFPYSTIIE